MPVPTIPSAISASSIQTEFGGSNPISLSEYYSGGVNVPSGTANATSVLIPSSGALRFSNFSGAQKIVSVSISLTVGENLDIYNSGSVGYSSNPPAFGSISSTSIIGGRTLISIYDFYYKGGTLTTEFQVSGDQRGSWWSYWEYTGDTYGTKTYNRSSATDPNGYYDGSTTIWIWSNDGSPTFDISGTWTIYG
jgi:hypothetical protein